MTNQLRRMIPILSGGNLVNTILNRFRGAGDSVGLVREDVGADSAYWLCQHLGAGRYWCAQLLNKTTGGKALHVMNHSQLRMPFVSEDQGAAAFVRTGANWSINQNSGAPTTYGGTYDRNGTVGQFVTYTSPANVTALLFYGVAISNGGIVKVAIDGDLTRANRLSTAQQLVDAGTIADTCLVANGGTLNPTDRLINFYSLATVADYRVRLADDLAAGVHTVVVTVTGYKQAASTDVRLYVSGMGYATASHRINTASATMQKTDDVFSFSGGSVWEYAFKLYPTGGGPATTYAGNGHGYESQTALTFTVDGAAAAPANGEIVAGTASVVATRTTELYSLDVDAGATKVADVITTFTVNPLTGLTVSAAFDWAGSYTIQTGYVAMMPNDPALDRGKNAATRATSLLNDDDGSLKVQGCTNLFYSWDTDGNLAALCYIPDPNLTLQDFVHLNAANMPFIEDRNAGGLNKVYFNRSGGANLETVTAASNWTVTSNRRVRFGSTSLF